MLRILKEDLYFLTPCGEFSVVFNNNRVYLLSRDLFVLNEQEIKFDFHQQKYDKRYCRGKTSVLWFQKYNSVILNGQIFVQCFDQIYVFGAQNQFAELCKVPDLDLSTYESFYGKLFTINNQLMLANNNKLYIYSQMFTEQIDLKCYYIADWCGVVVFLNENKVCQLLEDYSVKIIGVTNTSTLVVFCGAGTLVLQSASGLDLYIVDLVNIQLHKINNTYQPDDAVDQLSLSKIKHSLVIGEFGLQLTADKLKLIGPDFYSQIKEKFKRFEFNFQIFNVCSIMQISLSNKPQRMPYIFLNDMTVISTQYVVSTHVSRALKQFCDILHRITYYREYYSFRLSFILLLYIFIATIKPF
ncbi:Conserved_hypothetical protein [Hexamita inflata]|uniref:Transmembrane protein n=1 Tax=Hexamita inflata TaxID=28002 RepID=A0AA86U796_9EUKA|nr:Conserved hypothetical protein [Hexamita inflata]